MLQTPRATRGMVVAPHHLASQAGLAVLRDGGNAIEAMTAVAATIAVVYPHMNGLGGDNFWLIHAPGKQPVAIDACGAAAQQASIDYYKKLGHNSIPSRGPIAANTVAGAVSGWQSALQLSQQWDGKLALARLFEDAIYYAANGVPTTLSQHNNTATKQHEMHASPGFSELYTPDKQAPSIGELFKNPALAQTLKHLAESGLDDFYRGDLAKLIATDLQQSGSPLLAADLANHQAQRVTPLQLQLGDVRLYNLPPPTQGLASLLTLGVFSHLQCQQAEGFDYLHGLVEATKQAFHIRDQYITDPAYMATEASSFLTAENLSGMAKNIIRDKAASWGNEATKGDTVWLGVIDGEGRAVSMIQSIYWEFGSGVVLPQTGITWQNRGTSFQLDETALNSLKPGRKPFHTIQPALALFDDGRTMVYGTMGGEGQPQTQAAVFSRYAWYGQSLQQAISAPRWLLGRTWGSEQTNLRIENRFEADVITAMQQAGHDVEVVGAYEEFMGHAGALVDHPSGLIEGGADPRSDGLIAAF